MDALRELGDRFEYFRVVHVLKSAHLEARERAAAADDQHGALVVPGVGDAGHAVRDARASSHHSHAAAARRSRPALRRVAGDLLVAHIDDAHILIKARVIDRLHVPAAEGEDRIDAFLLDRADDEVAAVYQGHWGLLR
jgi:hypothetical protein